MLASSKPPAPGPGDALPASDERLLRLVHRTSHAGRALRRLLAEQAARIDLSDAELLVIWLCAESSAQGMVQGDLATAVGVSPAQMSGTAERLRRLGLIDVHRSSVDRRRQVWQATVGGRALLAQVRPLLVSLAAELDRQVSPAEQSAVCDLCDRLAWATGRDPSVSNLRIFAAPSADDVVKKGRDAA
ncbi:MAG: MarR family winged helix-turn-helix transcriptional regulator [Pirellulaceae bacterium]